MAPKARPGHNSRITAVRVHIAPHSVRITHVSVRIAPDSVRIAGLSDRIKPVGIGYRRAAVGTLLASPPISTGPRSSSPGRIAFLVYRIYQRRSGARPLPGR